MSKFISTQEQLPPTRQRVLALIEIDYIADVLKNKIGKKLYPTIVEYIAPRTAKAEDFLSDDYSYATEELQEYEEDTDTYWVLENWYESPYEGDTMWVISDPVKYWMEIPKLDDGVI